jgi:hypothetical protein
VLFALDSELCREVRVLNAPCYFDSKFGSGVGEIQFWTIAANSSYVQLMMMKMHYVNEVLRNNYNILLIDSDVVLMEDVRQHIHGQLRRVRPRAAVGRAHRDERHALVGVRRLLLHEGVAAHARIHGRGGAGDEA